MNTYSPTPRHTLILLGVCTHRNINCPTLTFYKLDRAMIGKNGLYPQANRFLQQHWELHVEALTSGFVTKATKVVCFRVCLKLNYVNQLYKLVSVSSFYYLVSLYLNQCFHRQLLNKIFSVISA